MVVKFHRRLNLKLTYQTCFIHLIMNACMHECSILLHNLFSQKRGKPHLVSYQVECLSAFNSKLYLCILCIYPEVGKALLIDQKGRWLITKKITSTLNCRFTLCFLSKCCLITAIHHMEIHQCKPVFFTQDKGTQKNYFYAEKELTAFKIMKSR